MSLPHFVNFVPFFFFFLFLVALWCYASPSPPLSRFYILKWSESWQQHNRQATQHVEGRFPLFCSRVQCTHAHWRIHVSVHIVLTSWQEAYTSGFPRQQVCKISNIDLHIVGLCAEIVRMLKTYIQATNKRTWDWSISNWLLNNSVWEHDFSDLEEAQTPVRLWCRDEKCKHFRVFWDYTGKKTLMRTQRITVQMHESIKNHTAETRVGEEKFQSCTQNPSMPVINHVHVPPPTQPPPPTPQC